MVGFCFYTLRNTWPKVCFEPVFTTVHVQEQEPLPSLENRFLFSRRCRSHLLQIYCRQGYLARLVVCVRTYLREYPTRQNIFDNRSYSSNYKEPVLTFNIVLAFLAFLSLMIVQCLHGKKLTYTRAVHRKSVKIAI